ncbi:ribonucleotide reductase subunit 1 [Psittacid alphaherpesvirus 5]|uniref:Ribonucleoside-diphosphate reductase n=1 Tax=Psittacid alphaherpesvirus 5 TaxID=2972693 RepID=A0A5P9JSA3_9ALPH|nr:ribonucleotide reductase subunit 1 [Psittacid alphaherpesvirus 5]QFU14576.1 ribonucleotide reductase subunit 1 [Psittacid alphaherpesvirus 5]
MEDILPDVLCQKERLDDLAAELIDLETRIIQRGYDIIEIGQSSSFDKITRENVIDRVSLIVNKLKASVKYDVNLYRLLSELVHLRIRARGVSFAQWLEEGDLNEDCKAFIVAYSSTVVEMHEWFMTEEYKRFSRIGLQSAQKYEAFYLSKLGNGNIETMSQFYTRLAAEVTRGIMKTPPFMAAMGNGTTPREVCSVYVEFYKVLARQELVPSTPTMLFFGKNTSVCASCFLLAPEIRTTEEALDFLGKEVVPHINSNGGMGISMQRYNMESQASLIHILKAMDSMIQAANNVSDRPTSACIYIEPWHREINKLLTIRGNMAASEETRCDNIFTALWVPDLFFKRYLADPEATWTLFGTHGEHLSDLYGDEFETEYCRLEEAGMGVDTVTVRDLMFRIVRSALITGTPFIMMKDACNRHYFADMRGRALKCSNLCTEIIHRADGEMNGVCNLMCVNLAALTVSGGNALKPAIFDYAKFRRTARLAAIFVNVMIQEGWFPTARTAYGNKQLRSMGIGLQGLHTSCLMQHMMLTDNRGLAFSTRTTELLALEAMNVSCQLCELGMPPFDGFENSYYANGSLHMDSWPNARPKYASEWDALRQRIVKCGLYNCQFVAMMPTVSSSQITEVSEGVSPLFGNLFSKISLSGEEIRPHTFLMDTVEALFPEKEDRLKALRNLDKSAWSIRTVFGELPRDHPLAKFEIAFEMSQAKLMHLCAERAPYVDHSQSLTLYVTEDANGSISASSVVELLLLAYKYGLKTAMYYCKVRKVTNNGIFTGACGNDIVCTVCQ